MEKHIFITALDRHRILDCLSILSEFPDKRDLPYIQYLEKEVLRAQVVLDSAEMPADVITMRSSARLRDMTSGALLDCTLVYPSERDPEKGLISILAPLGAAMIGYKAGDSFEADLPKGRTQFLIEAITYQPESAGETYL